MLSDTINYEYYKSKYIFDALLSHPNDLKYQNGSWIETAGIRQQFISGLTKTVHNEQE